MESNYFEKYSRCKDPDKQYKSYVWKTATGLQAVDGLEVSGYLLETAQKNIESEITMDETEELIRSYYNAKNTHADANTKEADIVSTKIAKLLSEEGFVFSAAQLLEIHKQLFEDIYPHAGKIRDFNISKAEWVLDGASVLYGNAPDIKAMLEYDISCEKEFSYKGLSLDQTIRHIARFTANLWQIHPFAEGNTRTVAVFLIKYLRTLGFDVSNDTFANNSWYFRNALVRANYNDITKGIFETTEYLEQILRNLLLKEEYKLSNKDLRVKEENLFDLYIQNSKHSQNTNNVGRPKKQLPENWNSIITEWQSGKITAGEAMKRTHMKRTSFYKYAGKLSQN